MGGIVVKKALPTFHAEQDEILDSSALVSGGLLG